MKKQLFLFRLLCLSLGVVLSLHQKCGADGPANDPQSASFLDRRETADFQLRIMTWNIGMDSILPPKGKRQKNFKRIVAAVRPDVICLQEASGGKLPGMMDRLIPLEGTQKWQMHRDSASDNVVVSRYPLARCSNERVTPIPLISPGLHLGFIGCLIDLPDDAGPLDVYVVATHFTSGGGGRVRERQKHADTIVRHLRDLRKGGDLPQATPAVILGDLNVYAQEPKDPAHHLTTLLTGNIVDNSTFGDDTELDWYGSYMAEVKPRHNGSGKQWYTWRSDKSRYPPSALDRIIYTDSVMKTVHSFVLNTTTMSKEHLSQSGLLQEDVLQNPSIPGEFDHLPLVADFTFRLEEIAKLRSSLKTE